MKPLAEPNYNASTKTKIAVIAGTALATGACIAHTMKKGNIKRVRDLEIGIKEGIDLCLASTLGGFTTGMLVDKPEHRKAKKKDCINQLIGNIFVPYGCLALANKITKPLNKTAQALIAIGTLIFSTFLGHSIANKANEKIFKEESGYKCTAKDTIFTDVDDYVFATSTVLKKKSLYKFTALLCPLTYLVSGYLAGTRQKDEPKKLDNYG